MTPRAELRQAEQALMRWPRSARLILKVRELRALIARKEETRARSLRGQIRRSLTGLDLDALARLARELEAQR